MSLPTLILREIRHRGGGFVLSVLAVAAAVAVVVASALLLEHGRRETQRILADKAADVAARVQAREAAVKQAGAELQDAVRKQMLQLGFNVLILPERQDLQELHLSGTLTETMPESYVTRLSESGIVTVNHLLPMVTRRIAWPERMTDVVLVGTRGEVPILHRVDKKPLLEAVAPGEMVVGYELHQKLQLTVGSPVTLRGVEFTVSKLHPQRGNVDDVTLWIDLAQAQRLLGLENLIHGILALECECAGDRISQVRAEIQGLLPGTQVVERYSQAVTRAEARAQAQATAVQALAEEKAAGAELIARETAAREELQGRQQQLAGWLVPVVILTAAAWVGLLAWSNVRQRREEIGILRTIGLGRFSLLGAIEGKAVLVGLVGGICGVGIGLLVTGCLVGAAEGATLWTLATAPSVVPTLWLAPLAAMLLAAAASWLPALLAANQDPAAILEAR